MPPQLRRFWPHAAAAVSVFAVCWFLVASAWGALENRMTSTIPEGPYTPASKEMFHFISTHTDPHAMIVFFKPRAMRLMTDRDSFATTRITDIPRADYIVINKLGGGKDQILDSPHSARNYALKTVFDNAAFTIFRVMRH